MGASSSGAPPTLPGCFVLCVVGRPLYGGARLIRLFGDSVRRSDGCDVRQHDDAPLEAAPVHRPGLLHFRVPANNSLLTTNRPAGFREVSRASYSMVGTQSVVDAVAGSRKRFAPAFVKRAHTETPKHRITACTQTSQESGRVRVYALWSAGGASSTAPIVRKADRMR
jgi:hypothetical protein